MARPKLIPDKDISKLLSSLIKEGWTIARRRGHVKIYDPAGVFRTVAECSGSDVRGIKNLRARLQRAKRDYTTNMEQRRVDAAPDTTHRGSDSRQSQPVLSSRRGVAGPGVQVVYAAGMGTGARNNSPVLLGHVRPAKQGVSMNEYFITMRGKLIGRGSTTLEPSVKFVYATLYHKLGVARKNTKCEEVSGEAHTNYVLLIDDKELCKVHVCSGRYTGKHPAFTVGYGEAERSHSRGAKFCQLLQSVCELYGEDTARKLKPSKEVQKWMRAHVISMDAILRWGKYPETPEVAPELTDAQEKPRLVTAPPGEAKPVSVGLGTFGITELPDGGVRFWLNLNSRWKELALDMLTR